MARSYSQHCALAKSLDVIGDRWSLLIVRELMLGQERWGQIRDGLPGIAKNLLSERLRDLEDAGVLVHEGDRYLLTDRGRALEPAVQALLLWGVPALAQASPNEEFRARWLAIAVDSHPELELVELDDDHAVLRAGGVEVSGPPREVAHRIAEMGLAAGVGGGV